MRGKGMRILVIGAGYVGLATAVVMSQTHEVTVVDIDENRVSLINSGTPPFEEVGMEPLLRKSVNRGRLQASDYESIPPGDDFVLFCVGTPPQRDGSVDISNLKAARDSVLENIEKLLDDYLVLAIRSTVPPGTTRSLLIEELEEHHMSDRIGVVFNPEFMRQGHAIHDIMNPNRIVIGASDSKALKRYHSLYRSIVKDKQISVYHVSIESAELSKYASNAFLATKVSFANEIASLAEKIPNTDPDEVMDIVTADNRINGNHMKPGLGFGGTCLPKDLAGLIQVGHSLGIPMDLLRGVASVNRATSIRLMSILNGELKDIKGKKVAVLGLTFKAGTDDTRRSQSLSLIEELNAAGADIWAHDPMANENTINEGLRTKFKRGDDIFKVTRDAHAVFLMTDWPLYEEIGIEKIMEPANGKLLIDGRRLFAQSPKPDYVKYRCLGSFCHS
ncbi:MAG: nucleotide sugar dehydrogenase [Candidatus Lokiarchaeota archaeon]|nr:nucleotide sugar dehydrogenase [Candidatus Lokiarchaeota archaeon]